MEGIRHQVPIDLVGADAGSVLAGEEVSAGSTRRGTAQAGPETATHRRLERHLDPRERNLLATSRVDQRDKHRGRTAGEDVYVNSPHPEPPPQRGRESCPLRGLEI